MSHNNLIELNTNYNYICFDMDVTGNNDHVLIYYTNSSGATLTSLKITGNQSRNIFKLSMANITSPGRIKYNANGDSLTTFYNIWLE